MIQLLAAGSPDDGVVPVLTDTQIDTLVAATVAATDEAATRSPRWRPRWAAPVAASAVGLTVLGLTVFDPAAAPAWSAVPHQLSAGALASSELECQTFMQSTASVVASEARGDSTFVLLDDTSQCLFAWGASMGGTNSDPGPAVGDRVEVVTNNSAGGMSTGVEHDVDGNLVPDTVQWMWSISGRVGPGVRSVVIHRGGAGDVVATVQNGWFMAWWPGESPGTSLTITSTTGTRQQVLSAP